MADSIKISTQVLADTAQKISTINNALDEKLASINREMNNLESTWKSDGARTIREKMNALKPTFEEYKREVESYAEFLRSTAQKYEITESVIQSNANEFK